MLTTLIVMSVLVLMRIITKYLTRLLDRIYNRAMLSGKRWQRRLVIWTCVHEWYFLIGLIDLLLERQIEKMAHWVNYHRQRAREHPIEYIGWLLLGLFVGSLISFVSTYLLFVRP